MILENLVETNYKKTGSIHQRCVTCSKTLLNRFNKSEGKLSVNTSDDEKLLNSSIDDLLNTISIPKVSYTDESNQKIR